MTSHAEGPAPEVAEVGSAPASAQTLFGPHLPIAVRYAEILADTGVSHGLIGPREVPRLWSRHILNCAVLTELLPEGSTLADIGSGAGLPGLALAVARPDLTIHLIEPLLRRTNWLEHTISQLDLSNVFVHRARAEEVAGSLQVEVVTARAVARLSKLSVWAAPLLVPDGELIALKGASAANEIQEDRGAISRAGGVEPRVQTIGENILEEPATVVRVRFPARAPKRRSGSRRRAHTRRS